MFALHTRAVTRHGLSMWGASLCLPAPPCAYQVLVRVLYAALNRRDHWIRLGLYVALQSAVAGGLLAQH